MAVTKAFIPVAGRGTRRLPITKAVEKSMLPIGNVPVIDFVVRDCLLACVTDFYFVVSESSDQIKQYYSHQPELEEYLRSNHKADMIPMVVPPKQASFHFVTQNMTTDKRYGTTIPVWLCRDYVEEGEQVLVIMGDQFFYRDDGGSNAADLISSVQESGSHCGLLGVSVPREEVSKYGIIEKDANGNYVRIVEHPSIEDSPGTLNNASFYLFDSKMFQYLDHDMMLPHEGEYWIIDPINRYVADGFPVHVSEAKGQYLDAGSVSGWLHANRVVLGDV